MKKIFVACAEQDMVAPSYGTCELAAYFHELSMQHSRKG